MTGIARVRVRDVLRQERIPVEPDPVREYVAIGVRSFGRGLFHYEPVPGDKLGSLRFFELAPERLVVSNIKGWEGAVAVSTAADAGCVASNRFLQYQPVDERVDLGWARWFFLSEPGNELLQQASPGSADRNRTLAVKRFEDLVIPLPPIDEQRRAAARLDAISERIGTASQHLERAAAQAIREALPKFVDHKIRQRPHVLTSVGELADLVSDVVHPGDDPAPAACFVGLQHVESHTGRNLGSDPLESVNGRKFRFAPGDVVYGYLRPYLNKVWVADRHGLCSVDQYVLRPKSSTPPQLLAHVLRGDEVLSRAIELTHNLQLPRLRSGLLLGLQARWPSSGDAETLVAELDRLSDRVRALAAARDRQARTLASLLPSALNREFAALNTNGAPLVRAHDHVA